MKQITKTGAVPLATMFNLLRNWCNLAIGLQRVERHAAAYHHISKKNGEEGDRPINFFLN